MRDLFNFKKAIVGSNLADSSKAGAMPGGSKAATGPAENAKLRVGMIGCANKGGHNLRAIAECGVTIAGLCDIDSKMLAPAAEAYPAAKTFADYRKMLETMKDSLDAVVVSTPDHCHAPAAMFAMNLGKHVYCEKPLTHNISEARLLAKTAQEKKLITQMGNQGHSSEGSAQQVAWLKSGVIGDVTEVHVWTDRPHGVWPQGPWLERLEKEHDNLRAALAYACSRRAEAELRLVARLWHFWLLHGHFAEGRSHLSSALSRAR